MSARTTTPPPPPPASAAPARPSAPDAAPDRPDRETPRAERCRALAELTRHYLAARRTLLFWLGTALLGLGWTIAAPGIGYLLDGDLFGIAVGGVFLLIAAALMVPTALALGGAAREDLRTRAALHAWAALDRDPRTRAQWHAPERALLLALPALLVCCAGPVLGAATVATGLHEHLTYPVAFGLAGILTVCGALALAKAADYYRLVVRELGPPARPKGGAHR